MSDPLSLSAQVPAEALERHAGPVLDLDDLIDLMLDLAKTDQPAYGTCATVRP
jgi:hypothetical protein